MKAEADAIVADLLALPSVTQATLAGSSRRLKETVADLDVVATAKDSGEPMDTLAAHPLVVKVLARGETKQRVRLRSGVELIFASFPTNPTERRCNISPAPRSTISSSAAGPSTAASR